VASSPSRTRRPDWGAVATYFRRRSIELRAGAKLSVVYAVTPIAGERPDPVPVVSGCPAGWRPTENPGQCLPQRDAPARYFQTAVPRSQFRHFQRLVAADALALYPNLLRRVDE
jgi:hypothetical protein